MLGVFYILEKSAYDVMKSTDGSAAGLIAMVFLAAAGLGILGFIWGWSSNGKKKATYKSPVRPLKH